MELAVRTNSHHRGWCEGKLQALVNDFCSSDVGIAEVIIDEGEYTSIASAASALRNAVRKETRFAKVRMKEGRIYLEKVER